MNENLVRVLAIAAMALLFIGAIMMVDWPKGVYDEGNVTDNPDVAEKLFGTDSDQGYGLIVFLTGVLLLVAMLGGVFLAKEEKQ